MNILVIRKSKLYVLPLQTPLFRSSIASYLLMEFPTKLKHTTVLLSKVTHSLSLHSTSVFITAKSPLRGQKLIRSQNVSCKHSIKLCELLIWKTKIGNRNCFFFCETTAPHPISTLESPLLSYFLDANSLPNCLNSSTRRRPVH